MIIDIKSRTYIQSSDFIHCPSKFVLKADEKVEAKLIMLKVGVANGCQDCIPLPGS